MKSQSEILGLALVVVLIFLGLVIYVRFAMTADQDAALPTQLMYKQLPIVMNDVLLQTNIPECGNEQLRIVLMRCFEGQSVCDSHQGTCTYARNWVEQRLNETLGTWNMGYIYNVTIDGNQHNQFPAIVNDCHRRNMDTEIFPLPMSGRILESRLTICH